MYPINSQSIKATPSSPWNTPFSCSDSFLEKKQILLLYGNSVRCLIQCHIARLYKKNPKLRYFISFSYANWLSSLIES